MLRNIHFHTLFHFWKCMLRSIRNVKLLKCVSLICLSPLFLFYSSLAQQSSSFCNCRAHLNFLSFTMRDITMATSEGCRVGQKLSYRFSFASWTVLASEEIFISTCLSSRVITLRFNSETQWQMFFLLYGRHICAPPRGTNVVSPYKAQ